VTTTPALIDDALRRDRACTASMLSGPSGLPAWLVSDDPAGYRRQLGEVPAYLSMSDSGTMSGWILEDSRRDRRQRNRSESRWHIAHHAANAA
jgi:hypothetical protein